MTTEHQHQSMLIAWARMTEGTWPELELLHAIPLGGARHPATGKKLKAEGVKKGVPDLCLPVARGPWNGMYIEMKVKGRYPSKEQRWWLAKLTEQGYLAVVCHGFNQAVDVITEYMGGVESEETGRE
jgi:hypothetical protein